MKTGKKRLMMVRLGKNGKILYFSAAASEQLSTYESADVFVGEDSMALRGVPQGTYHVAQEQGRCRKTISSKELVAWISKRFQCELGNCLPVWTGEEEGVLFFGGIQPSSKKAYLLDESYVLFTVGYNRRSGEWAYVHDNWIEFTKEIRDNMPTRLSAYQCGQTVLLKADSAGVLQLTPRRQSGTLMLVSNALACSLRKLYGGIEQGMRLRAALVKDGVLLGPSEELLNTETLSSLMPIDHTDRHLCFLTLGREKSGTIYVSAYAHKAMEAAKQVNIYEATGFLALKVEEGGQFQIRQFGNTRNFFSKLFYDAWTARWPNKKMFLLYHQGLWLLLTSPLPPAEVPPESAFKKCTLGKK